ncbi:bifunctional diguanylate cyclase/phosphodiesterase [Sphingomonas albertensis]|uniref:EAL domain-containing protein n=1 Tax=Sphingomonas albertensis TaxID=2762591 RepID=A0ABR7ANH0_9SPHN|nr:EAL domain-containing protein [Sphingomonas albertensis]MBC3941978.1 EAL domain-containing protein [Sphingomonas albertensis]
MALALLAIGLSVSNKIHQADLRITRLSEALGHEDRLDQAQRRLRQDIGRLTRDAERGVKVSNAGWIDLRERIADFKRRSSQTAQSPDGRSEVRSAPIKEVQQAAAAFAKASDQLIETSRLRPSGIKSAMPRFLGSLTALETSRSQARWALTSAIWKAADQNRRESRRDIVSVLLGGLVIVAMVFGMAIWLRRRLVSPITVMAARLREFKVGASDGEVPGMERADELGDLARGLYEYRNAVESRRAAERRAEFLANHDMLTGLANRLLFENRLAHELARSGRTGDIVAVFAVDLDAFKAINDRLGHAGGDRVLKRTAQLLSSCVRGDDLVARIGGDEFAIIQVARSQPVAAEALISRIFKMASAPSDEGVAIKMSVGVALSEPGQAGEELHERADLALYRAKADGRNTARIYDKHLKDEESQRVQLARDLENAISANELRLVFQPIADTVSLEIVAYEALLRWLHPRRGEIPPDVFVPIAESSGLIGTIGSWMIDQALRAASTWDPRVSLAINLSPIQFRSVSLATEIRDLSRHWGVAFDRLELEVTESATLLGFQRDNVLATLKTLRDYGAKVVMDDFGTGHSSLSNLKEFTFDKIKIDRSFVATMDSHASSSSIVKATIGLGKSLGLIIVAEGVETDEQLSILRQWGCDQVQGFLIGMPADCLPVAPTGQHATCASGAGRKP